jgi:RHS repeat-associated protein
LRNGDGNRVKKIVRGSPDETTLYVNKYYEKNITNSEVTTSYYLGSKLIAQRKGTTLSYVLQDHLGSTSATASDAGVGTSTITYFPFGSVRATTGTVPTDKKFTSQRLDQTGLYFYNARYYDATIGRFISADTIVSDIFNPQTLNRYSYCINNPLKYVDPSGHMSASEAYALLDIAFSYTTPTGGGDWGGIFISVEPDTSFDLPATNRQLDKNKPIWVGELILSKNKFIFDSQTNKEIIMSSETYNKLHAQGWTDYDIAFMLNLQPFPRIRVTDYYETPSPSPTLTMNSGASGLAITICIFQPEAAKRAADYIRANGGKPYPGTRGGGIYLNDGRDGTTIINAPGPFREYDVPCEYGGRGLGRLAISNSGVWYTFDHYYNWMRLY